MTILVVSFLTFSLIVDGFDLAYLLYFDCCVTDQPKRIYREVVLMTEDRNLRVKALSSNMPVQTVADFIKWAGLQ